ncbi:hypothetical protein H072_8828 [Dactylellina haptotyla CBS 200.50]|uniref:cAMP-dependent protein kinase regulatory subunit n=1 Tax=Dactylellina haptotyla (strain CBS 200.50) TaxID=1284197 RepID=S8BQF9_DACHA|nr:hypothetical protein H072_8828 [Dactylellina haptotyla CBS 200.50]
MSLVPLPPAYIHERTVLEREIQKQNPTDVLQFCANHFNKRLESQRAEFLLSGTNAAGSSASAFGGFAAASGGRASPGLVPVETSFPGFNTSTTFQSAASPPTTEIGPNEAIIEEEEPDLGQSPTASTFKQFGGFGPKDGLSEQAARISTSPPPAGTTFAPRGRPAQSTLSPPSAPSSAFRSPSPSNDFPTNYNTNRRTSVSAESMVPSSASEDWTPPFTQKSVEQLGRLNSAIADNLLFRNLDEDQTKQVLGALTEKTIRHKDTRIITQGDVGDFFYVVEKGVFDVYVNPAGSMTSGPEGMGKKVTTIESGGSFGELALMYNAPRAATVISTTPDSTLWSLDRVTFRKILMENTFKKRRMYEAFLETVPLLSGLMPYERSKIADALETKSYPAEAVIIQEGDPGDNFYIIENGTAEVKKRSEGVKVLKTYTKGDYFGELALLNDAPRAASVVAKDKVKVATLGKEGFQRLLGPVTEIMRRNDPSQQQAAAALQPQVDGPNDTEMGGVIVDGNYSLS